MGSSARDCCVAQTALQSMRKGRQDTELGNRTASDDLLIVSKSVFLKIALYSVGQLPGNGQEVNAFASANRSHVSFPRSYREADSPREGPSPLEPKDKHHLTSSPQRGHRA